MALSITFNPQNLAMAAQPLIVMLYNSSYNTYTKYRYVLDITVTSGAIKDRKKVLPNTIGYGVFDISRTVESFLDSTYRQTTLLGADTGDISNIAERTAVSGSTSFARSNQTSLYIKIEAREEYEIAGVVTLSSVQDTVELFAIDATAQYVDGVNYLDETIYGNDDAVTKRFLTNAPDVVYCPADGYGTISFINYYEGTLADNKIVEIGYIGYDDAGGVTGDEYYYNTIGIDLSTAGISEGFTAISAGNSPYVMAHLLFGWQNIEDDNNLSGGFDNSTRIKVKCFSANGVVMESPYLAVLQCSLYPNVRLRFKNAFGTWDYFNFNKVSKKSEALTKKSYKALTGTWQSSTFSYPNYQRENTQYGFQGTTSLLVNSDFLSEDEYTWLSELIRSNDVFVYEGGVWQPVIIAESNYEYKTDLVDGIQKQLALKLEYANPLRLQQ